ncbi:hypothetical protein ACLKA6_001434 [Drosophila palustris]
MENDDYQPLLRRRRNSYLKWTESQVLEFLELVLDLVKDVPESLEKPTAQKFYAKVMESEPELLVDEYENTPLRDDSGGNTDDENPVAPPAPPSPPLINLERINRSPRFFAAF